MQSARYVDVGKAMYIELLKIIYVRFQHQYLPLGMSDMFSVIQQS
jgi:hypothetical protein